MSDVASDPLPRGLRVAGMFAFMLGGGLVLESAALWTGAAITLIGVALFAGGFVAQRQRAVLAKEVREKP